MLIPSIILGGVIGCLAAYGALTLINGQPPSQTAATAPQIVKTQPAVKAWDEDAAPIPSPPRPRQRPRAVQPTPKAADDLPAVEPERPAPFSSIAPVPTTITSIPIAASQPVAPPAPAVNSPPEPPKPKPSVVAVLDFKEPAVRAVCIPPDGITLNSILCDVALSDKVRNAETADSFTQKLAKSSEVTYELPLHIEGGGAAIQIRMIYNAKSVVCELRPQFSLPTLGVETLTIARGNSVRNRLANAIAAATTARSALPNLRSDLRAIQADLRTAQTAVNRSNSPTANTSGTVGAIRQLNLAADRVSRNIARAEAALADGPLAATDLRCLEAIASAVQGCAGAEVEIRFYSGDVTLAAEMR